MDWQNLAAVSAVFVLAGIVKGVTGLGLPTVAVSLLTLWMSPTQAAGLIVVPTLLTNVAQCRGLRLRPLARALWPAWIALAALTVLAPDLRSAIGTAGTHRALGAVLLAYGAWGLWRPEPQARSKPTFLKGAAFGSATGLLASMTAVFVFPLVPYLQTLRLDKDEMVQALGLSFTVATIALAARLHVLGEPTPFSLQSTLALPAAIAGLLLGGAVRARISAVVFRRSLFAALIGLGVTNLAGGT